MKYLKWFVLVSLLIILDQISKLWIVEHIALNKIKTVIPNIVSLTYLRNYGAAFSILQNQQWLFSLITIVVITAAIYYLIKQKNASLWMKLALILIISGGIGNFIDRLRLGYVVDMVHLDFINFAIFNVADSYLSIGVFLLVLALWREEDETKN
ncbi:lipoprotein signal peptidase [Streptococcus urinalis FB127-CNA-2]|uniref:Lipoprotein signal peptidase n=1 Tax=Streptococcus urinalis 2285-97 TaxID=764291 RepID=G5KFC2_9STRE|nr:signal peptidase II [Streptococcus urinalis]EHJ55701.1 signal peptidase II [Streptococcus urinalis 2285-97]EKS22024.1 lipoprotein signal peptidase [Streptococcus urinalis FB127-CNA-2]VEF31836.1 Lipoprotein signal peptidase [Streptococcus urinalis]